MTLKSLFFRELAARMLSADREERDQACLDFRVSWPELDPGEKVALSVLLAHVSVDEADEEIREEQLHALSTAAGLEDLAPAVRQLVRNRGTQGLSKSELVSWHHIVDEP